MTKKTIHNFMEERKKLNEIVMKHCGDKIKKFYSLDAQVYQSGVLSKKTKEMLGLVASLVMRCGECIDYHLLQCYEQGVTIDELGEVLSIGLIIGGSITIPHIRKVFASWDELNNSGNDRS